MLVLRLSAVLALVTRASRSPFVVLFLAVVLVVLLVAPAAAQWVGAGHRMPNSPPPSVIERASPRPGCRYFPETGHNLCGPFLQYWDRFGGLLMFGYPLTEEYFAAELGDAAHNGVMTQWFERARFEHHRGEIPQRFDVLQGHLAREILAMLTSGSPPPIGQGSGSGWVGEGHRMPSAPPQSAIDPAAPRPGCRFFPETRHNLCGNALRYWEAFGGLLMFGYPLTEEYFAPELGHPGHEGLMTQWFERGRLEAHPDEVPGRFDTLQGHLGREILALLTSGGGVGIPSPTATPRPAVSPTPGLVPSPTPTRTPTPTPTPAPRVRTATVQIVGLPARVLGHALPGLGTDQFLVAGDLRDGSGRGVPGTVYVCLVEITTGDMVEGVATTPPRCTAAITATATGSYTSPALRFRDLAGNDGGAAGLAACAEVDGRPGPTAGDSCGSSPAWVYFAAARVPQLVPASLNNGGGATIPFSGFQECLSVNFGVPANGYASSCPGATSGFDAQLFGRFVIDYPASAPAPQLRLLYVIQDADPPYAAPWPASASWTVCSVAPGATAQPQEGTDRKVATEQLARGLNTSVHNVWICGPGTAGLGAPIRFEIYWDVNANGTLETGVDALVIPANSAPLPVG